MKIGSKTSIFNFALRERRAELGWSQAELAARAGCPLQFVNCIEDLRMPDCAISRVIERLNTIAQVLESPFDDLFPADYLAAIEAKKLPRRRTPIIWCREVRIDELPPADEVFQIESPEVNLIEAEDAQALPADVQNLLGTLPALERRVLELRFGIGEPGGHEKTLQEIRPILKMTCERIRVTEARALRKLRHPSKSGGLRSYLHDQEPEEAKAE